MKLSAVAFLVLILLGLFPSSAEAATLDDVRDRGVLRCGIANALPGFSTAGTNGNWSGFDADFCRAIAAAIFNDPAKVEFTTLAPEERTVALRRGDIDVLMGNTAWTMTGEVVLGIRFPAVNYYNGQGFMVPKKLGISSTLELSGATICTRSDPETERRAKNYFTARKMTVKFVTFETAADTVKAYEAGQCNAYMADRVRLHTGRAGLAAPDSHLVLPEVATNEPLGPAVRFGDGEWFRIVRWIVYATIKAEEYGVSSKTLADSIASDHIVVRRLLGVEGVFGKKLGLDNDWAARIIRHTGNYAEIYDRNIGAGSGLKMDRGLNVLWRDGGLLFAPPIR